MPPAPLQPQPVEAQAKPSAHLWELLPSGTAEGCRAPLEYARNRLPSIRREHIATEGSHAGEIVLTRGTSLDQKLATLISSVSTALDEYRRLAADEAGPDFEPEAGVPASRAKVADVVTQANELDAKLGQAQTTINEIAQSDSIRADDLKRQFQDARGLSQLASAEARMPRVVPGWLRKTVAALKKFPDIIRRTMSGLQTGADIAEVWVIRWHEFKHEGVQFLFEQFRKTAKAGERTADILEGKQNGVQVEDPQSESETDEASGAMHAIRRREQLQAAVRGALPELEKAEEFLKLHRQVLDFGGGGAAHREAEQRRAEHQAKLLTAMRELANVERYLAMHRQYTVAASTNGAPTSTDVVVDPTLGRVGPGFTQQVFEHLVRMILREVGRPMQSGEVVAAFAERGIPLGGTNPGKTAWNRLWKAKTNGVLDHFEGLGYWLESVPLPERAVQAAEVARSHRLKLRVKRGSARKPGNARGRKRVLSESEVATARSWLLSGKPLSEVCADLGGITPTCLLAYIPGGARALRAQYPHLAKPTKFRKRAQKPGHKPTGRPRSLSSEQIETVKDMYAAGTSVSHIATEMKVSSRAIYSALGGSRKRVKPTDH